MDHHQLFYIDGKWTPPVVAASLDVIDPSTEQPFTRIAVGSAADVDKAVGAAKRAFASFSRYSRERRLALLESVLAAYNARGEDSRGRSRRRWARRSPSPARRRCGPDGSTSRRQSAPCAATSSAVGAAVR